MPASQEALKTRSLCHNRMFVHLPQLLSIKGQTTVHCTYSVQHTSRRSAAHNTQSLSGTDEGCGFHEEVNKSSGCSLSSQLHCPGLGSEGLLLHSTRDSNDVMYTCVYIYVCCIHSVLFIIVWFVIKGNCIGTGLVITFKVGFGDIDLRCICYAHPFSCIRP